MLEVIKSKDSGSSLGEDQQISNHIFMFFTPCSLNSSILKFFGYRRSLSAVSVENNVHQAP